MIAFVLIVTEPDTEEQILNKLSEYGEVIEAHFVTGEFDIIAKVRGKDIKEISEFVSKEVRAWEGVQRTVTALSIKEIKGKSAY
ncbi:MAG: Lrp/AsnC family transcriptional regulator [Candidatus Baldrarchaeia archaeon]